MCLLGVPCLQTVLTQRPAGPLWVHPVPGLGATLVASTFKGSKERCGEGRGHVWVGGTVHMTTLSSDHQLHGSKSHTFFSKLLKAESAGGRATPPENLGAHAAS